MPIRCKKCLRFNHLANFCKNGQLCPNCGQAKHLSGPLNEECENIKSCVNCTDNLLDNYKHHAYDKPCPIFVKQKELQAIKTLNKIDHKSALSIYNERHCNNNESYASDLRSQSTPNSIPSVHRNPTQTSTSQTDSIAVTRRQITPMEDTSGSELLNANVIKPSTSSTQPNRNLTSTLLTGNKI